MHGDPSTAGGYSPHLQDSGNILPDQLHVVRFSGVARCSLWEWLIGHAVPAGKNKLSELSLLIFSLPPCVVCAVLRYRRFIQ